MDRSFTPGTLVVIDCERVPLFDSNVIIWSPEVAAIRPNNDNPVKAWVPRGSTGTVVAVDGDRLLCVFEGGMGWTNTRWTRRA